MPLRSSDLTHCAASSPSFPCFSCVSVGPCARCCTEIGPHRPEIGTGRSQKRACLNQSQFSFSFTWLFFFFFISLVNLKRGISLVILVLSLSFPRILWVRQGQIFLVNFEVFLDKNPTWWTFRIFLFFSSGKGRGSPGRQGGGGSVFFVKNPRKGAGFSGGGGGEGAGRVSAGNLEEGGLNIFFLG